MLGSEQVSFIDKVFESYLIEHHGGDFHQLTANADPHTHHAVVVNAMTLFEANMEVGDYFNAYPDEVLPIFDRVLQRTANELSENVSPKHNDGRLRPTLHARITGLPVCPELTRETIPRSRDVGHFVSVTGIVIRTSVAKVLEFERDYICSRCGHVFTVQAEFDQFYTFVTPTLCPHPDGCNSFKFRCLSGGCDPASCRDYQEIKIQEQVQRLSVGSVPRTLVVILEDDLVDSCKSGDDVTVYGVNSLRWKPFSENSCCDVELVLKANNIEVTNAQSSAAALFMKDVQKDFEDFWESYKHNPLTGRNRILLSLCPQVFGMYVVKLAVALVLAGGVQRTDCSGTRTRGECHMLLIGDPGTGKSQFLKYATKIISRSVLTAGIGSTNAGLTVAAVKDGGEWHLEAGALVLSDGGLCCIDEFNSIKEHDRISIHEAMEQQSISVAKAGIVCKLNTRTSILAAANPKGHYDVNEPLSVNVALASPLLSRFDLVLVLLDTRNAEWDSIISSFILEDKGLPSESSSLWSMEKMKAYFTVIKGLQPQVSEEADLVLRRYFQLQRQSRGRNAARTTVRMLESLSRLAEAHARLMYRESVTIEDAVTAVSVMECSMHGGALLGDVNTLLTSFPEEASNQYRCQCELLLSKLGLPTLLQKEMQRLDRLKNVNSEEVQDENPNENSSNDFLRDSPSPLHHDVCLSTSTPHKPASSSSSSHDGSQTGRRSISAALCVKMAAGSEGQTDSLEKLSEFVFKPRKLRDSSENHHIGLSNKHPIKQKTPESDSRRGQVSPFTNIKDKSSNKSRRRETGDEGEAAESNKNTLKRKRTDVMITPTSPVHTPKTPIGASAEEKLSRFAFSNKPPTDGTHSEITSWKGHMTESALKEQRKESVSTATGGGHGLSREKTRLPPPPPPAPPTAPPAASSCIFSGLLNSTDLTSDALDTDWTLETLNTSKI